MVEQVPLPPDQHPDKRRALCSLVYRTTPGTSYGTKEAFVGVRNTTFIYAKPMDVKNTIGHDRATGEQKFAGRPRGRAGYFGKLRIQTVLVFVNSRMPYGPSSRPWPEAFTPPKGTRGSLATI
jgi:hypothetical protein